MLPPLYLRKERTVCQRALAQPVPLAPSQRDVVAYADPAGAPVARWPWHYSSKPTRRNKRVTLNCTARPVIWLSDA
jgi:hypothetical protein